MYRSIHPQQISLFDAVQDRRVVRKQAGGKRFRHTYNEIISIENLLASWKEFLSGKSRRKDVAEFLVHFVDNILALHQALREKTYCHGSYEAFKINDPKPRDIHKASVADRLIHHAVYRILYPYFDRQFIWDSYSCRLGKGTHRALRRFRIFARTVSCNHTRTIWILKCDIRKFFASIDHKILKAVLARHVYDVDILWLLGQLIDSFQTVGKVGIGLPLGNLTSQLFVNILMNEFDQFVKRELKIKYYIRYADDFVILHESRIYVENILPKLSGFLETRLKLSLHPQKVSIATMASGVDFLGWVHFPRHRVLRTKTKQRMFKKLGQNQSKGTVASYLGMLSHGNTYKLKSKMRKLDFI